MRVRHLVLREAPPRQATAATIELKSEFVTLELVHERQINERRRWCGHACRKAGLLRIGGPRRQLSPARFALDDHGRAAGLTRRIDGLAEEARSRG